MTSQALEFIRLEETIKEVAGDGELFFLPNPGNWGDGVIRYATERFLRDAGIAYSVVREGEATSVPDGATLLFGGGGAWCDTWRSGASIVEAARAKFRRVVVLPSSYGYPLAPQTNVVHFARDRAESVKYCPTATFCHDMVFYLGPVRSELGVGSGQFFRTDKESARRTPLPPDNIDISNQGNHHSPVTPFLEQVAAFAEVHTDRLHVAIVACLLGRDVHLYPSNYFKNRSVFDASVEPYFPNVTFHPTCP